MRLNNYLGYILVVSVMGCSLEVLASDKKTTKAVAAPAATAAAPAVTADKGAPISATELTQAAYAFPSDLVAGASSTQVANYAWRLFIAANNLTAASLADGSTREQPTQSFITTGGKNLWSNPLVFESFYHRTESYPYHPASLPPIPSPVGQVPVYRFQPIAGATKSSAPSAGSDAGFVVTNGQYVNLDETNQIGQNFLYYRKSNSPNFPVLFMAKVNSVEASYAHQRPKPSSASSWVFPDGVIEVKAAWRRVKDITNSDPNSYHQATASYYVGVEGQTPQLVTETFALIALHIIQKTPNYPQFIFTTFEHVDAVTRDKNNNIIDPAFQYTSQNLAYAAGDPTTAQPFGAYTQNAPGLPPASNAVASYKLPPAGLLPTGYVTVVEPKDIISEVNDVNNQVLKTIQSVDPKSVWTNYRLKGAQLMPSSTETDPNFYLANIVVESSQPGIQLFRGSISGTGKPTFTNNRQAKNLTTTPLTYGQPVPAANVDMGGCQGCHGIAETALGGDFSFLVTAAQGGGEAVDTVAPADTSAAQLQKAKATTVLHRSLKLP